VSNLGNLVRFLSWLEQVPQDVHLGDYIRSCITDLDFSSFVTQANKINFYARVCIKNRSGPIISLVTQIELNLNNEKLILSFSNGREYEIPFDDLISMQEMPLEDVHIALVTKTANPIIKGLTSCSPRRTDDMGPKRAQA